MSIPGFVEFSNLRPTGETIVYVPYYMPVTSPNWARSDEELLAEAFACLKTVNPMLTDADRIDGARRAAAPCPAGLPARFRGKHPARADPRRRSADRRHLLLLSGRSRHFGERALRQADGFGNWRSHSLDFGAAMKMKTGEGMSDLSKTYDARFKATGLDKRHKVWKVLCASYFQNIIPE